MSLKTEGKRKGKEKMTVTRFEYLRILSLEHAALMLCEGNFNFCDGSCGRVRNTCTDKEREKCCISWLKQPVMSNVPKD
jgi:hypothetical protein